MTQQACSSGNQLAETLNRDCYCIALDRQALRKKLAAHLSADLSEQLLGAQGNLFADSPVFLSREHVQKMALLISAVERVTQNDAYREAVLATAPVSARQDFGPRGVFSSYDFHLGAAGPQLIEINTNAGGVLLNLYLAAAQQACCREVADLLGGKTNFVAAEREIISMFKAEWHFQHPGQTLRTIAIVDSEPTGQFLYPEFLLFQSLFERYGIEAIIADPGDFMLQANALWIGKKRIDLVYNRLTDFYLQMPETSCLLKAYQKGLAVFTPSPTIYALQADKRNLPLLADSRRLEEFGVKAEDISTLAHSLPSTVAVTANNVEQLWKNRKQLFFKPATGYGSRGAYRGAKLTQRVWRDISHCDANYIAQAIVPPSERQLIINGEKRSLKLDLRCVTYKGRIQQLSARLYQGQTTNLRTAGGGLATVFTTRMS